MKRRALIMLAALPALANQLPPPGFPDPRERPKRLPDGRLQSEAILREDYERNLRDLEQMEELLKKIEEALEKAASGKVNSGFFKDLEEVEKLSKRMHSRMRRF